MDVFIAEVNNHLQFRTFHGKEKRRSLKTLH